MCRVSPSVKRIARDVGDQQVLDHVHRGELLAEAVDGRDERDEQRRDAAAPRGEPPPARGPGPALAPRGAPARDVHAEVARERDEDDGRERPAGVDLHAGIVACRGPSTFEGGGGGRRARTLMRPCDENVEGGAGGRRARRRWARRTRRSTRPTVAAGPPGSVRAYVTATTRRAPAAVSAAAQASSVAPVVCTSSTSSTSEGAAAVAATTSRSGARRAARPAPVCRFVVSCRRSTAAQGSPSRSASAAAISPAGSNPRTRRRCRCGGTGTTASAPGGGRTAASCAAMSPAAGNAPRNFSSPHERSRYARVRHRRMGGRERRAGRRAPAAMARERAARAAPPAQPRQRAHAVGAQQRGRIAHRCPAGEARRWRQEREQVTEAGHRPRTIAAIACRVTRRPSRMCARTQATQPPTGRRARLDGGAVSQVGPRRSASVSRRSSAR